MALMTVHSGMQEVPTLNPGVLMIHKEPPAMVVIISEVSADGQGFHGTSLDDGVHMEWDAASFVPFVGKLTLEQ